MKRLLATLLLLPSVMLTLHAQDPTPTDTTIIFEPVSPDLISSAAYRPLRNAWGIDLMISNNGFGAGGFWRHEFSDEISGFVGLAISDVKDEGEVEYYDYYGRPIIPGKKNRLLMFPMSFGVQYRLFKDDIVDNFRPFVSAAVGPSMIFVAPYANRTVYQLPNGQRFIQEEQIDFFSSLKYGQAKYTVGAYIGGGAYFGLDRGTLSGISFRYYFIPFTKGIEILEGSYVKQFGGFFITLNFGSFY